MNHVYHLKFCGLKIQIYEYYISLQTNIFSKKGCKMQVLVEFRHQQCSGEVKHIKHCYFVSTQLRYISVVDSPLNSMQQLNVPQSGIDIHDMVGQRWSIFTL